MSKAEFVVKLRPEIMNKYNHAYLAKHIKRALKEWISRSDDDEDVNLTRLEAIVKVRVTGKGEE